MRIKKLVIMLLSTMSLAVLLNGCGSSSKDSAISAGDVGRVGDTACTQCHSTVADKLTGESIIAQYQKSAHFAGDQGCESCHGGGAMHNGVGPIPFPKPDAARCATCHTGTNSTVLQAGLALEGAEKDPTNPSNHANGGYEGVVTSEKCYRCHSGEGAVLSNVAGYTGDKTVIDDTTRMLLQDRDFSKFSGITCSTCHQHGGALRQVNTKSAGSVVAWDPNGNRKLDQFDLCTSCHTYQNPDGTLVASGTAASGTKPATAPFYHNTAWNRAIVSTHWDNYSTGYAKSATVMEGYVIRKTGANPCFDCHGHEAKTNTRLGRPATVYTDWAKSAHAGGLLTKKYAAANATPVTANRTTQAALYAQQGQAQFDAVMAAGPNGDESSWPHYDWDASNRASCQRCHSSTGAANFMKNPPKYNADGTQTTSTGLVQGYNVAQSFTAAGGSVTSSSASANNSSLNSFGHLTGWSRSSTGAITPSGQNESLYCWGCHNNAGTGALHAPGPFTFYYGNVKTNVNPNGVLMTFPDAKNSNVCLTCHSGRTEVAQVIKNDTRDGSNASIMYPHYMASSLIVFGNGGYDYANRSYAAPSYYAHDKIGISATGTGTTTGPCAGCHMASPNKHLFTNVTKDTAGKITGITSTACATCHAGNYELTATKLEEEAEEYKAALRVLASAFVPKGIYYDANENNYFFNDPLLRATANRITNWKAVADSYTPVASWKDVMGAAYNLYTLDHDAGWAHNRYYSKRLIWDSIDFIYNGALDNDVAAAIDAQVTALRLSAEDATAAKAYLGAARP